MSRKKVKVIQSVLVLILNFITIFSLSIYGDVQLPVLELEEIFHIEDTGSDFYFKMPSSPVVDQKGFIFVNDENQLLMFSPLGKWLRNFYRKGQGPFEMTRPNGVWIENDDIVFSSVNPQKLIWFNRNGKPLKEIRVRGQVGMDFFLTYYNNRFYYLKETFQNTKNKAVYVDIPVGLISVLPSEGSFKTEPITFPKKYFVMNTSWIMNVYFVQTALLKDNIVLIAPDGNYNIKQLDLKKMTLTSWLEEKYKKVYIKEEWKNKLEVVRFPHYGPSGKEYKIFERKALDDIQRIWINGDKVWVITSKFDESSRRMVVDVFDSNAKKQGSMLLPIPEGIHLFQMSYSRIGFYSGKIYAFESSDDGVYSLGCYKIKNIPDWAKPAS